MISPRDKKSSKKSVIKVFQLWSFGIILAFVLFLPGQNYYETLNLEVKPLLVRAHELDNYKASQYPKRSGPSTQPTISAKAAFVKDLESSVVFYSKNADTKLPIASITKLMTALVALDYYKTNDVLTVKRLVNGSGESEMGLYVGDNVTVQNLIYGLLVPSGNDAAYTLADNYPGGIENFIYSMNKKAVSLHMENTHFENPSGLDSPNHFSTVKDISLLTIEALKDQFISQVVSTYAITLTDITGKRVYRMKNVNQFLGYLYGADGVKTGFTDLAGQCLVASVTRNGHRIVSTVLNSEDRFRDSAGLIEWVYYNHTWINPDDNENTRRN